MKVLVTGATGFVGRHVVQRLTRDHDVIALVRPSGQVDARPGVIAVDLAAPDFSDALPSRVDAIVHLAQGSGRFPDAALLLHDVNVGSTVRLADYGRRVGIRAFVFASTGSVYARSAEPLLETGPISPTGYYAASKWAAELLLEPYRSSMSVIVLRLFVPYGPGQTGRMVPSIVSAVLEGRPVTVVNGGQPRVNPVYVDDVAEVIARCLSHSAPGVMNVAGPRVLSVAEIADIAGVLSGRSPIFDQRTEAEHWNLIADTGRCRAFMGAFGWMDPTEGIRRLIEGGAGNA